jgi:serine O-acetyltransferase
MHILVGVIARLTAVGGVRLLKVLLPNKAKCRLLDGDETCTSVCEMSSSNASGRHSFSELVFSDLDRHRPGGKASWLAVISRCLTIPGMLASVILRAQQCLHRSGRVRLASMLRTVSTVVVSADFGPGMEIGTGLLLAHPIGVNIGYGLKIGNNVTLTGGVTAAARYYTPRPDQEFATICDGAIIGAHAVLVGGVRIGVNSVVGANSVVLSDVADGAVVLGVPARQVGVNNEAPAEESAS